MTKYIICLGDGMADHRIASLNHKTPLEYANCPAIDFIAKHGELGMVHTVPQGFSPGSDVANMGILGYNPADYYTGRGPIEAASLKVVCSENETIFRCNLVTIEKDIMVDFTSEHISNDESFALISELNEAFKHKAVRFVPGVGYRHIMVVGELFKDLSSTAPHDITGQAIKDYIPKGDKQELVSELMAEARLVLAKSVVNKKRIDAGKRPASDIWPWSQGKYPRLPAFKETYGLTGGIVTAVDLLKGLAVLTGLEAPNVSGATGFLDTDYKAKIKASFDILERHDFCYIHIEAPDECGHMGRPDLKVQAIEDFDKQVVAPVLEYQKQNPDTVVLVLPDHPTPCDIRTHTHEPVPYCIYYPANKQGSGLVYTEESARQTKREFETPWALLSYFLSLGATA
jgi:2,3-bisphosphoglycerate-independent phosphoglycerate mutase